MGCGCFKKKSSDYYDGYYESNVDLYKYAAYEPNADLYKTTPILEKETAKKPKKKKYSKSDVSLNIADKNELQSRPHSAPPLHAPYDNTSDEEDLDSLDDKKLREIQLRSIFLKSLPSLGFLEKEIADLLSESELVPYPTPFVCTYPYDARSKNELSFREGDKLQLFDNVYVNWCTATFYGMQGAPLGFVPSSHIAPLGSVEANPWFFTISTRSDAERVLMHASNNVGAFLVRNCKQGDASYVLSVRVPFKVAHFLVRGSEQQKDLYITSNKMFPTLSELVKYYQAKKRGSIPHLKIPCNKIEAPQTPGLSQVLEASWEIPRSSIKFVKKLGEGNFGEVFEGLWNDKVSVAVKKLKQDGLVEKEFMHEVNIMKKIIHSKIVQLYGISTAKAPYYIITEFLKNGDLLTFLRKGDGSNLPEEKLIDIGAQIANGMEYLESMHFIHRDLAARNILVGDVGTCKIADFGLARVIKGPGMYVADKVTKLPLKWCAPESLRLKQFTTKSDVWSFGIVLVEIIERGMDPYPGLGNLEVFKQVCKGYIMPLSIMPRCPEKLYEIMKKCWEFQPAHRPSFQTLLNSLEKFYDEERGYESVY